MSRSQPVTVSLFSLASYIRESFITVFAVVTHTPLALVTEALSASGSHLPPTLVSRPTFALFTSVTHSLFNIFVSESFATFVIESKLQC